MEGTFCSHVFGLNEGLNTMFNVVHSLLMKQFLSHYIVLQDVGVACMALLGNVGKQHFYFANVHVLFSYGHLYQKYMGIYTERSDLKK